MVFLDTYLFAILTFVISAKPAQLQSQQKGKTGVDGSARSHINFEILCTEAGNCTCLFEKLNVTVKCTSAGHKLEEIISELPKTTTNL